MSHNISNKLMLTSSLSVSLSNKCLTSETWIKLYKLSRRHPKTRSETAVVQFQFSPGGESLPLCHYSFYTPPLFLGKHDEDTIFIWILSLFFPSSDCSVKTFFFFLLQIHTAASGTNFDLEHLTFSCCSALTHPMCVRK